MRLERREISITDIKLAEEEGATAGRFSGYGAFFGNKDSYGDVIERGAFKQTLREWEARKKWPPMLLQHGGGFFGGGADDMLPIGKWSHMEENAKGLKVEGELFALNTERGQYIYEGLKAGALDGLSIGFRIREAVTGTRPSEPKRKLTNIDLWEVSVVTFPANPKARVSGVKTVAPMELRQLEGRLRDEGGLSRSEAVTAAAVFRDWMQQREAGDPGDASRDETSELLATIGQLAASVRSASQR